jgi:roadblock/LC7 domain-containing protein
MCVAVSSADLRVLQVGSFVFLRKTSAWCCFMFRACSCAAVIQCLCFYLEACSFYPLGGMHWLHCQFASIHVVASFSMCMPNTLVVHLSFQTFLVYGGILWHPILSWWVRSHSFSTGIYVNLVFLHVLLLSFFSVLVHLSVMVGTI